MKFNQNFAWQRKFYAERRFCKPLQLAVLENRYVLFIGLENLIMPMFTGNRLAVVNNLPCFEFKFRDFSGLHDLPAFPFNSFQIVAVCDFYTYVRYIQQGLVKADGM